MPKSIRAVVRNCEGEHLFTLDSDEEIASYEILAGRGQVERATKMKKGRLCIIFKLQPPPPPDIDPSKSANSACSLTSSDSHGLAGMHFAEARVNRFQLERWIGFGLIPGVAS